MSYAQKEAKLTPEEIRFYSRLGTIFVIGAVSLALLFTWVFLMLGAHA